MIPEIFSWMKVCYFGLSIVIHEYVLIQIVSCSSGGMFHVTVLLEGERPPRRRVNMFTSKIVLRLTPSLFHQL